jgi:cytochrome c5
MRFTVILAVLTVGFLVAGCGGGSDSVYDVLDRPQPGASAAPSSSSAPVLTDEKAKAFLSFRCTKCHTTTPIKKARKSKAEWEARIQRCKDEGLLIAPAEAASLVNWLSFKYGN